MIRSRRVTRRGVMEWGKEGGDERGRIGGAEGSSSIAGAILSSFLFNFYLGFFILGFLSFGATFLFFRVFCFLFFYFILVLVLLIPSDTRPWGEWNNLDSSAGLCVLLSVNSDLRQLVPSSSCLSHHFIRLFI